ncbi:hypothetical protein MN608_10308 [Microdochium nivale]|nr:hypothetical protein MN608_10308 [Microdochium nivale]
MRTTSKVVTSPKCSSMRAWVSSATMTVPTLTSLALKVVAANISELDGRHLGHVPSPLLIELWKLVKKDRDWTLSDVRYWGLFVQSLINNWGYTDGDGPELGMWCIRTHFTQNSPQSLLKILEPATSLTIEFITHLQLSEGIDCTIRDIIALVKMINLGILEIVQPISVPNNVTAFPRVTDAVIREWASAKNPFPVLRVLRIWGEDFTTFRSLQYLDKFPSLAIYDVAGKWDDWPKNLGIPPSWTSKRKVWSEGLLEAIARTYKCFDGDNDPRRTESAETLIQRQVHATQMLTSTVVSCGIEMTADTSTDTELPSQWARREHMSDLWGQLSFSRIGQLRQDADFIDAGLSIPLPQPHVGPLPLPPRPLVCVQSVDAKKGLNAFQRKNMSLRHCTFVQAAFVPRAERTREQTPLSRPDQERNQLYDRAGSSSKRSGESSHSAVRARKLKKQHHISLSDFM